MSSLLTPRSPRTRAVCLLPGFALAVLGGLTVAPHAALADAQVEVQLDGKDLEQARDAAAPIAVREYLGRILEYDVEEARRSDLESVIVANADAFVIADTLTYVTHSRFTIAVELDDAAITAALELMEVPLVRDDPEDEW